jgi:glycerate 2-kinase
VWLLKHLHENPLPETERVFAFGLGKAACAMTQALADEISLTDTLVITKHASALTIEPVTVIEGNHPVPGEASLSAGNAALTFVSQLTPRDLLICLISGGGSALMTMPRVPLADLQSLTSTLLASGAPIDEINILRRHLDELKGGGFAGFATSRGARIVSLILSDVVGDELEAIASGPTTPDPTSLEDAIAVLEKYDLKNKIPISIISSLEETLKPNNPIFNKIQNTIIASNEIALQAAQVQAMSEGFQAHVFRVDIVGEARDLGSEIAIELRRLLSSMPRPFCLLAGGEATVTIKGNGNGGRNQELALAAVDILAGLKDIVFISIATDGEDGPTDAAGAIVTGESAQRAESLGMNAADYLSRNDAYTFFAKMDDLIITGPSGTNVNDLVLCFAF